MKTMIAVAKQEHETITVDKENLYVAIPWPENQEYMGEDWFRDEAILSVGNEDVVGSSAHFVPLKRLL